MPKYCLGFIFNEDLSRVLLIHKHSGPYPDCYNGIGGHIKSNEHSAQAMIRETIEETELIIIPAWHYMFTILFPTETELSVYCTKISDKTLNTLHGKEIDEGTLYAFTVINCLDVKNTNLAGEGNLPYFIHYAQTLLKGELK